MTPYAVSAVDVTPEDVLLGLLQQEKAATIYIDRRARSAYDVVYKVQHRHFGTYHVTHREPSSAPEFDDPTDPDFWFQFAGVDRHGFLGLRPGRLVGFGLDIGARKDRLRQFYCAAPGIFSNCAAADRAPCLLVMHDFYRANRSASLAKYGWYALTFPESNPERLVAHVGRAPTPPREECMSFGVPPGTYFPISPDLGTRVSVDPEGRRRRDLATLAVTPDRMRLVMQTGVEDPESIDDDLVVVDVCSSPNANQRPMEVQNCDGTVADDKQESARTPGTIGVEMGAFLPDGPHAGWEGEPSFSPDGKWLAYLKTTPITDDENLDSDESLPRDLWLARNTRRVDGMSKRRNTVNLTARLSASVLEYHWSCRGRCLLIKIDDRGESPMYQLDLELRPNVVHHFPELEAWQTLDDAGMRAGRGLVYKAASSAFIKEFGVSGTGLSMFLIESALATPGRTVAERVDRCTRTAPTAAQPFSCTRYLPEEDEPSTPADEVAVQKLTDFEVDRTFVTLGGDRRHRDDGEPERLQGFVFYPPCFSGSAEVECSGVPGHGFPVLVWVHGGPHNATRNRLDILLNSFLRGHGDASLVGANGFVIVAPNPEGSTGYGEAYRQGVARHWGGQAYQDVLDTVKFASSSSGLAKALGGRIDTEKVFVAGESYGGYIVNLLQSGKRLVGHESLNIAGLLSLYGVFDLKDYPCNTDQAWFPLRQFGYNQFDCNPPDQQENEWHIAAGHAAYSLYRPQYDPQKYFDCELLAAGHRDRPSICDKSEGSPIKRFPLLAVHGTRDRRVEIHESRKLMHAMKRSNEFRDRTGLGEPTPFRGCQVHGGDHGFSHEMLGEVYIAAINFFSCRSGRSALACNLIGADGEDDIGKKYGDTYQLDCRNTWENWSPMTLLERVVQAQARLSR